MKMKTLENSSAFIGLLMRSPDLGDGWRKVSNMLRELATKEVNKAPELFELMADADGMRVRLTERGQIVAAYM
jgi:hypothetical protein